MKNNSTRREFLAMGVSLPVAAMASTTDLADRSGESALTLSPVSSTQLSFRTLGRTGLKVTTVGFGCMITSDASVIERAADLGINYFDTARGYQQGNNERMVGAALKRKRKDIILSSKSGAGDKQGALADLETSLAELGTDHLDIWYLHGKSSMEEVKDELIEAQQIAKQQGKIRFAGVSTHAPTVLIPELVKNGVMDVVLTVYNFSMDNETGEAIEQGAKAGMGIVGMKAMAGGFRRRPPAPPPSGPGARPPDAPPPGARPRAQGRPPTPPPQLSRQGAMLAALKWVIKNRKVHTTVPSMTDMAQLDENLKAMTESYGPAEEKLLARQLEYITPFYCRMCGKCEGTCAKGLPVADILRYLTYADGYGQFSLAREEFLTLPSEVAEVRCRECATCTVHCPFGVKVAKRLTRAQELFA